MEKRRLSSFLQDLTRISRELKQVSSRARTARGEALTHCQRELEALKTQYQDLTEPLTLAAPLQERRHV